MKRPGLFCLLFPLITLLLSSCGGGSEGSDQRDLLLFMTTDSWTVESTASDYYYLEGFASTGNAPDYCPIVDPDETRQHTGVTVTWTNESTGQWGLAGQTSAYGCVFLMGCGCWHIWEATVPLQMGPNRILIFAEDTEGSEDSMVFSVTRF